MHDKTHFNRSILCVDDEEDVLESYRDVLSADPEKDLFAEILSKGDDHGPFFSEKKPQYTLFLARSGEEAVRIVKQEKARGNHMAAGFFDMRMPGGIDGYETLKQIREIDPQVLCAVVTAYYDRNLEQIRRLFVEDQQDELLYFKKPFSAIELRQTALNMVSAWNRKRIEENQFQELSLANRRLKSEIEERERAEQEQKKLQAELLHAQKMEIVGRLAGGVAHDFNNMLSAIIGYAELALYSLSDDHPVKEYVSNVKEAGLKAESVVRQLLAFSRKQVLEMKVVHLNELVKNMTNMLARLIGEDIAIELEIKAPTRTVMVDPVQIEQILMNLAVNSRDAMPDGGRFIIAVSDVEITEPITDRLPGIMPDSYVLLRVSDTGEGMAPEVLEKIFEPFFTTKKVGKGTGLGLATVYGIVKQHNGYIYADSKEGQGTTFEVYLPETLTVQEKASEAEPATMPKGTETVLVAEDDQATRKLVCNTLQPLGYKVLEASDGAEALEVSNSYGGEIDVLLTDVIMPGFNGRELAKKVLAARPGIEVIYMSGYTDEIIASHGVLDPGVSFLQKPLSPSVLANKLRAVLDSK